MTPALLDHQIVTGWFPVTRPDANSVSVMKLNAKGAIAIAAVVGAMAASEASAAPVTRTCTTVTIGKGKAYGIRSTGMSCAKVRPVIARCLRRQALHGWRISTAPSPDDTDPAGLKVLDRGAAHVVFQVRGRRACA